MGKGVAELFKKRFPEMFEDYKAPLRRARRAPGRALSLRGHLRRPHRQLSDQGSLAFRRPGSRTSNGVSIIWPRICAGWGITSIALPPLGCGNGGLAWSEVGPLIYKKLGGLPIDVELYAPFGTPKNELTLEFLAGPSQMSLEGQGLKATPLKPEWVVLMEVLARAGGSSPMRIRSTHESFRRFAM